MAKEMYETAAAILHAAKAEILPYDATSLGIPGQAIHEHSTCRMGADPKRSALNGFCQSHDVKNLFVVDGAAFTTASEKNPTLTILALAWRSTDYLARRDEGRPVITGTASQRKKHGPKSVPRICHARISLTTRPSTSVSRKWRPWNL